MKRNWLITTVLVASIIGLSLSLLSCTAHKINLRNTLDTKETIQVQAYWDPIADASLDMPNYAPKYEVLFNNLSPAHPSQEYEADTFKAFFPKGSVPVGHVWKLDMNEVLPFLRQFHPGATGEMHINPGGESVVEIFNLVSSVWSRQRKVWSQRVPSRVYGHFRQLMPKSSSESMQNSNWIRMPLPTLHRHSLLDG